MLVKAAIFVIKPVQRLLNALLRIFFGGVQIPLNNRQVNDKAIAPFEARAIRAAKVIFFMVLSSLNRAPSVAAGDSSLSAYHPRSRHLSIGRLRQGMCRVRRQTAACDVGMWSVRGDTAGALWLPLRPIPPSSPKVR